MLFSLLVHSIHNSTFLFLIIIHFFLCILHSIFFSCSGITLQYSAFSNNTVQKNKIKFKTAKHGNQWEFVWTQEQCTGTHHTRKKNYKNEERRNRKGFIIEEHPVQQSFLLSKSRRGSGGSVEMPKEEVSHQRREEEK